MALTINDQPVDFGCAELVDQLWLDKLNSWRNKSFECLLDAQIAIDGLSTDLSDTICQEIADRTFVSVDTGSPATVTLPAGGTWSVIATSFSTSSNNEMTPNSTGTIQPSTQSAGQNFAGTVAGGTTFGGTSSGGSDLTISIFGIRTDC